MDVDLLVNPKIVGTADLETVDIPTIPFDDLPPSSTSAPAPPPAPKLVPNLEETGPIQLQGFDNFNAEAFAPVKTVKMSEEALQKKNTNFFVSLNVYLS
jgi:hypothetical protein